MRQPLKQFPLVLVAAASVFSFFHPGRWLAADELYSGWVNLFNGNDLHGWVQRGGNA